MGLFRGAISIMGRFPQMPYWAVFPLKNPLENSPLRKGPSRGSSSGKALYGVRGFASISGSFSQKKLSINIQSSCCRPAFEISVSLQDLPSFLNLGVSQEGSRLAGHQNPFGSCLPHGLCLCFSCFLERCD